MQALKPDLEASQSRSKNSTCRWHVNTLLMEEIYKKCRFGAKKEDISKNYAAKLAQTIYFE